jgi:hypothetical protein
MASPVLAGDWRSVLETKTVRHFLQAVGFAFAALLVGLAIYVIEKYLLRPDSRFVENPASVMMRACGLAHFCVGWLFLFTSPGLRGFTAWTRLLALTALGVGLCVACDSLGASRNPYIFF